MVLTTVSTEIASTRLSTLYHKRNEIKKNNNQTTNHIQYQTFDLFFTDINLYPFTTSIPIPKKNNNPKNITENALSKFLVVATSIHTLAN
ncbi:TPA: hypothetical protein DEP21_04155 [Patescibacteria group bacterium]|nr:hypothetical protein [Candidatus Gracilibacteria bacterium]